MERLSGYGITAQDFKCFGSESQGFNALRRINLVIGRNNTGKSALLDIVDYAVKPYDLASFAHRGSARPRIWLHAELGTDLIKKVFPQNASGGGIPGANHRAYGMTLAGSSIRVDLSSTEEKECVLEAEVVAPARKYIDRLARELGNPFKGLRFARITAERDVVEEGGAGSDELSLKANGRGATNIVQRVINDEALPGDLVEQTLLDDLNRVMGPDACFTRLSVQRTRSGNWMIYLDEASKGRVSLANSGSGLKTIILVLVNMLLMPNLEHVPSANYVFAFEELENNLHPGLQRRLLNYVEAKLLETGAIAFITTHSAAAINLFSHVDDVQILHVRHDGESAEVASIDGSARQFDVLDDLGVKASDLLQANGVVWVEGISDVIYLRCWIDLYCRMVGCRSPVEGTEFAFMEYGGRCLSHYEFGSLTKAEQVAVDVELLLPALAISRNTYVVMDSDRRSSSSNLNSTKQTVVNKAGGHWISVGREIENYVHPEIASHVFGRSPKKYELAADVYRECIGKRFDKKKAASAVASQLSLDAWEHRDLSEQVARLVEAIRTWNPSP